MTYHFYCLEILLFGNSAGQLSPKGFHLKWHTFALHAKIQDTCRSPCKFQDKNKIMFPTTFTSNLYDFMLHFHFWCSVRATFDNLIHSADACTLAMAWVGYARPCGLKSYLFNTGYLKCYNTVQKKVDSPSKFTELVCHKSRLPYILHFKCLNLLQSSHTSPNSHMYAMAWYPPPPPPHTN